MVVEAVCMLLFSFFGASTHIVASTHERDSRPIVIFVDRGPKDMMYHVDAVPVSLFDIRRALEGKWDGNKKPDKQRKVVIIVHEDVTFSRAEELRLLTRAAGYEDPRIFYFGKDRRLMVEVTYLDGIAFSPTGPGVQNP